MKAEILVGGRTCVTEVHEVDGAATAITKAGGIETTSQSIARTTLMARTGKAGPKAQ